MDNADLLTRRRAGLDDSGVVEIVCDEELVNLREDGVEPRRDGCKLFVHLLVSGAQAQTTPGFKLKALLSFSPIKV